MSRWPLKDAPFWQTAPFFRILLPLVVGIVLYANAWHHAYQYVFAGIGIAALLTYAVIALGGCNRLRIISTIAMHAALVAAGWWLSAAQDVRNNPHWFGRQLKAHAFIARVETPPAEKAKTYRLRVSLQTAQYGNTARPAAGNAYIYIYKDADSLTLQQGDTILLPGNWQPIKNSGNPHEFDYARYCARNNLYYQQFLSAADVQRVGAASFRSLSFTQRTHNWCISQLKRYVQDTATLGLLQAMLIGDEANLDTEIRQAYADTGIIHIIAISGSHITFFFVLLTFMFAWIKPKRWQWLKYAMAIPLLWFYVFMAGASPSAVRAVLMFTILSIGWMSRRTPNPLNQLLCTAFLLLCTQPMWLYAIGFQLSFVAVLSLILFFRPLHNLLKPKNKILNALWTTIVSSLAAELLVAPLVVYYFHLFPINFVLANVAAYIFMGIVLVLGMLIIVFSWWPAAAAAAAVLATWLTKLFHQIVYFFQYLNPPAFQRLHISGWQLLLIYTVIAGTMFWLSKRKSIGLITGLSAACVLFAAFIYEYANTQDQERVVVYNINHCTHIELIHGRRYIVLATDTSAAFNSGKRYAIEPAHITWHAHKRDGALLHNYFSLQGSRFLLLNQLPGLDDTAHLQVDYLLLNYMPKSLSALQSRFGSATIVVGGLVGRTKALKLKEEAALLGIRVHTTALDGAFIFPAP